MTNVDFMLVIFKSQTITWLRTRVRKYNSSALGTSFGCEGPGLNVITWTLVSDHGNARRSKKPTRARTNYGLHHA